MNDVKLGDIVKIIKSDGGAPKSTIGLYGIVWKLYVNDIDGIVVMIMFGVDNFWFYEVGEIETCDV